MSNLSQAANYTPKQRASKIKSYIWRSTPDRDREAIAARALRLHEDDGVPIDESWLVSAAEGGIDVAEILCVVDGVEPVELDGLPFDVSSIQDMRAEVEWVRSRLDAKKVEPCDAPSVGAYSMWAWARRNDQNRRDFYLVFVKALMPTKSKGDADEERRVRESSEDAIALVDRLRRTLKNVVGSVVRERDDSH